MADLNNTKIAIILVVGCILAGGLMGGMVLLLTQHPVHQVIHTTSAPEPIGPYSQAIRSDDLVFVSGQIGIDPTTGNVSETISEQTEQVMKNLQSILAESGLNFSHVIQARIYLTNLSDFTVVNEVYGKYLGNNHPSRATVQVSGLPKGAMVEIEMIAHS